LARNALDVLDAHCLHAEALQRLIMAKAWGPERTDDPLWFIAAAAHAVRGIPPLLPHTIDQCAEVLRAELKAKGIAP
jgi:hypothetical protein